MSNGLTIRRASEEDIGAILALLADDELGKLRETKAGAEHAAAFAAIDRDANQLLAVAELEGRIIGCFQLSFIPGLSRGGMWRGQIEAVRVASRLRGHGHGASMMRWAIERCRERACGLVQLTSDRKRPEAHRFYEKLGFTASHAGFKLRLQGE